ncbi:MAG: hypothetical protein M3O34_02320 [Chloroflexota bacterium]|nr:hypothetical protein [Chloroflexota bacterium]
MRRVAYRIALLAVVLIAALAPNEGGAQAPSDCYPETGFCISNPALREYFRLRGGVRTFGYPVSRELTLLGFRVQLFQGHVLQVQPDGRVTTMNLLQEGLMPATLINGSTFPAPDPALIAATPKVDDPEYAARIVEFAGRQAPNDWGGRPVRFFDTFVGTVDLATAFPNGGGSPSLLPLLNLEIWGAPTSRPMTDPVNPNFVYQRFQRGIMHYRQDCGCTERILLGDWFRSVITGQGLPDDLAREMTGGRFLRQYRPGAPGALARPAELPRTDLADAFAPEEPTSGAAPPPEGRPLGTEQPRSEFVYGVMLANPLETADLAGAAGFTHMWSYVPWSNVEPSKGTFAFNTRDPWGQTTANDLTNGLIAARRANLKLVLRLAGPPAWAGGAVYRLDPVDVEDYAYAAVAHGRGTIEYLQVFNELNLPFEWGTTPTDPAAYVQILAAARRGAKRADPRVQVIAAPAAPRTGGLLGTMEDVDWVDGLYRAGGKGHFDFLGVHTYLGNFPPEVDPSCAPMCFRSMERVRAIMEKHGDGDTQAFITEIGALEQTQNDLREMEWMELPPATRAQRLVRALQLARTDYPWIAGAMVFNLDAATVPWHPPTSPEHWFSLLNPDKSPRPAYAMVQRARRSGTLP